MRRTGKRGPTDTDLIAAGPEELRELLVAAEELRDAGRSMQAARHLKHIEARLLRRIGERPQQSLLEMYAQACYLRGVSVADHSDLGDLWDAVGLYRKGLLASAETDSALLRSTGLLHLSKAYRLLGSYRLALRLSMLAEQISSRPWVSGRAGILEGRIAGILQDRSLLESSLAKVQRALDAGVTGGQVNRLAFAEVEARARAALGDVDRAVEILLEATQQDERLPMTWRSIARVTLGELLAGLGEGTLASSVLSEAVSMTRALNLVRQSARALASASLLGITIDASAGARCRELAARIAEIPSGMADWASYQALVAAALIHLFVPPLSHPSVQAESWDRVDRPDLLLVNNAPLGFWRMVRECHRARLVVCEIKNVTAVGNPEVNQLCSYFDDEKGRFGMLVKRTTATSNETRIAVRKYRRGDLPLILSDADMTEMLRARAVGRDPSVVLSERYAAFMAMY
jgi:tetratricopeptide (TPR) repeat protein